MIRMLKIVDRELSKAASVTLDFLQNKVDGAGDYASRVAAAGTEWNNKLSSGFKQMAFRTIRTTLSEMCIGPVRCAYCEDSLADEIEHILPKSWFPESTFRWLNYVFACGPCNGPKGNRCGVVVGDSVTELERRRGDPAAPPVSGQSAMINPRTEDPLYFLELDIGGQTESGEAIEGTFNFLPAIGISAKDEARASFTINVLGLNREVIRVARANAFGGFRARLQQYVEIKEHLAPASELEELKGDLLRTPHLTVFAEMRRQRKFWDYLRDIFDKAPEIMDWPLQASLSKAAAGFPSPRPSRDG